jgi:hypothetical protein
MTAADEKTWTEWRESGGEEEFFEAVNEYRHAAPGEPHSAAFKRLRLAADRFVQAHSAADRLREGDDDTNAATLIDGA